MSSIGISSLEAAQQLGNVLYVSEGGDNNSAVKGSLHKTWRDPWEAVRSSQYQLGDWIYVLPGEWTFGPDGSGAYREQSEGLELNTLNENYYYFEAGAKLTGVGLTGASSLRLWSNTINNLVNGKVIIRGKGEFNRTGVGLTIPGDCLIQIEGETFINGELTMRSTSDFNFYKANTVIVDAGRDNIMNLGPSGVIPPEYGRSQNIFIQHVYFEFPESLGYPSDTNGMFKSNVLRNGYTVNVNVGYMYAINMGHIGINLLADDGNLNFNFGTLINTIREVRNGTFTFDNKNVITKPRAAPLTNTQVLPIVYSILRNYGTGGIRVNFRCQYLETDTHLCFSSSNGNQWYNFEIGRIKQASNCPTIIHQQGAAVTATAYKLGEVYGVNTLATIKASTPLSVRNSYLNISSAAEPVIINQNAGADLTIQNTVVENDGTVAAIQASVASNVKVAGTFDANTIIADPNVTINKLDEYV